VGFTEKYVYAGDAQALSGIDPADSGADAAHALHNCGKVDANVIRGMCTEVFGITHFGVQPRRSYDRFRWYAADVQRSPAKQRALDECNFSAHR
jgi:hypothetical protein